MSIYDYLIGGEFEKYYRRAHIVEEMVDNDNIKYVKPFFESLSSDNLKVRYIDNFWNAYRLIKSNKVGKIVIATRILIVNQDHSEEPCSCTEGNICDLNEEGKYSSHSVSLIRHKKGGKIYMFDPNGVFNKKTEQWLYVSADGKCLYDSKDFKKIYTIDLPSHRGIQRHSNTKNEEYIDDQGYCMFYNFFAIQYLTKYKGRKYITTIIKEKTDIPSKQKLIAAKGKRKSFILFYPDSKLYEIFPRDKNIGSRTREVIDKIFKI